LKKQPVPIEVARPFAAKPAGIETRSAVEGIHREARVVGHGQAVGEPGVVEGLQGRVLEERRPGFLGRGQEAEVPRAQDRNGNPSTSFFISPQLAGILTGEQEIARVIGRT